MGRLTTPLDVSTRDVFPLGYFPRQDVSSARFRRPRTFLLLCNETQNALVASIPPKSGVEIGRNSAPLLSSRPPSGFLLKMLIAQ